MAYRDDRQALALQVAELERENDRLKAEVVDLRDTARRGREQERDERKRTSRHGCTMCGGTLHAVAVFTGPLQSPVSLQVSTSRFGAAGGGFTHSTPVKAMACSSCGFIHNFIDIDKADPAMVTGHGEDEALDLSHADDE